MTGFVVRYLWVVSPHFLHTTIVSAGLVCFGVWVTRTLPGDVGAAYVPILFCQSFGASSGYRLAADAGQYDALLVSGARRELIAVTHLLLSTGPGIVAWVVVAIAETGYLGMSEGVGWTLQGAVGLLLVSAVAWAVTLPTARFTGGVLWVLSMGLMAASPNGVGWLRSTLEPASGDLHVPSAMAALILCPFLLLVPGLEEAVSDPWVLTGLGAIAVAALSGGVGWLVTRDYPGRV